MFNFLAAVKTEVLNDPRGAEVLMMSKVEDGMRRVLRVSFHDTESRDKFISEYARELNLDMLSISPTQPCLWEQIADRITTRLIAQDVFDDHFDNDGKGDYKNPNERRRRRTYNEAD